MNALLQGGPAGGQVKIVADNLPIEGGITFETTDKPGARGWYGCVLQRDGGWLVDNQGFVILVWCGWDGEGVE